MTRRPPTVGPELLAALRRRDETALDGWYRAEHPEVYRLCLGFLADGAEADDVAQDAMLHLLDHLDRYDASRPYGAWRTSVVLNLCRDRLRRNAARRRAEDGPAPLGAGPLPTPAGEPADEAERGEVRAALVACLEHLSPREREVFVLRDLEEVPTERAAELLGIGASSVRSLLALARRRMRTLLAPRLAELSGEEAAGA